jgi:hypothetical protein
LLFFHEKVLRFEEIEALMNILEERKLENIP